MKAPEKITVDFAPDTLDMMFKRLKETKWPDIIGEDSWVYGVPRSWLQEMVDFWISEWNWETRVLAIWIWPIGLIFFLYGCFKEYFNKNNKDER